jgi:dethiobiotin synthetase
MGVITLRGQSMKYKSALLNYINKTANVDKTEVDLSMYDRSLNMTPFSKIMNNIRLNKDSKPDIDALGYQDSIELAKSLKKQADTIKSKLNSLDDKGGWGSMLNKIKSLIDYINKKYVV